MHIRHITRAIIEHSINKDFHFKINLLAIKNHIEKYLNLSKNWLNKRFI